MKDTRFSTVFDSTADLLSGVDIDDVGDIETLLMFLFARPMGVDEVWDDDGAASSLDVNVHGNDGSIGFVYDFGPYPRLLDTGCDYAAVGSVAARRVS